MDKQQMGGMFGPTEDEVRTAIDTQGRADIQTLFANARNPLMLVAGNMADAGRDFGRMFEQAAGYEDPRVRKAQLMQQVKQRVLSSGVTPNDPIAFARASAQEFARVGLGDEAMGAAQFAKQMQDKQDEFKQKQYEFQTKEVDMTREEMKNRLEVARIMASARGEGTSTLRDFTGADIARGEEMFKARIAANPEALATFRKSGIWAGIRTALGGEPTDQKVLDAVAKEIGLEFASLVQDKRMPADAAYSMAERNVLARRAIGSNSGTSSPSAPTPPKKGESEMEWFVNWQSKEENKGKTPEQGCKEYEAATGRRCTMREVTPTGQGTTPAPTAAPIAAEPITGLIQRNPTPPQGVSQRPQVLRQSKLAEQDPRVVAYNLLREHESKLAAWKQYKNAANPQVMVAEIDDYKRRVREALDVLAQGMTPKQREQLQAIANENIYGTR